MKGLGKGSSVESVHGSLLAVGELLGHSGEFMLARYKEVTPLRPSNLFVLPPRGGAALWMLLALLMRRWPMPPLSFGQGLLAPLVS